MYVPPQCDRTAAVGDLRGGVRSSYAAYDSTAAFLRGKSFPLCGGMIHYDSTAAVRDLRERPPYAAVWYNTTILI